jgi:hypothetical protein
LVESKFIPVAPLPPTLMSAPEKDDFLKLFKGKHLQAIFTKYLSASTRSRKPSQHTLWNSISSNAPSHHTKLPGLNATSISAVQEIAKDMENLWSGKVFDYSLNHLLTIYFRSHLAPKREIRNMESLSEYEELAKQKKLERQTHTSRNSIRQKIRREQKIAKKFEKRLEAVDQAAEQTKWHTKIRYTQELITKHNLSKQDYHNDTASNIIEIEEWFLSDEEDEELSLSDNEEHADKHQHNDAVLAAEPAIPSEKEVSAARINKFINLAKKLLYQAVSIGTLPERLNEEKKRFKNISEDGRKAFIRIFTLLRNYMPEKDLRQSIVAKRPIVLISNFVQRCAGYHKFTRRIFPVINTAKVHSFNIDTAAIYEMMASSVVEEHFNIVDHNDNPITSCRFAISNKSATFANFFDIGEINKICASYGQTFQHRLIYTPDQTVHLVGELLPSVAPCVSFHEQRRKSKSREVKTPEVNALSSRKVQAVSEIDARVKELSKKGRAAAKKLKELKNNVRKINEIRKDSAKGASRQQVTKTWKSQKNEKNCVQLLILHTQKTIKDLRSEKYNLTSKKESMFTLAYFL